MKRVFSSASEVIHLWAQQSQEEGRTGNVYFINTKELYSYGRHYPLGLFVTNKKGEQAVIINTQGYSSTTSKHIAWARQATNHHKQFMLPNTEAMKAVVDATHYNNPKRIAAALSEAIERRIDGYYSNLRSDTKKRRAATLESWKEGALSSCNNYIELLDFFGVKMTAKAKNAIAKLSGLSPVEAREAAQKAAAKEAKAREIAYAKRAKEKAALVALAIPAWLGGADHIQTAQGLRNTRELLREQPDVYLRIKGDNIETSMGVDFPVEHGIKALPIIEEVKLSGLGWKRNGRTIHLGHYQLDEILPNGDVKAGCHLVPYAEINRIAKILGH